MKKSIFEIALEAEKYIKTKPSLVALLLEHYKNKAAILGHSRVINRRSVATEGWFTDLFKRKKEEKVVDKTEIEKLKDIIDSIEDSLTLVADQKKWEVTSKYVSPKVRTGQDLINFFDDLTKFYSILGSYYKNITERVHELEEMAIYSIDTDDKNDNAAPTLVKKWETCKSNCFKAKEFHLAQNGQNIVEKKHHDTVIKTSMDLRDKHGILSVMYRDVDIKCVGDSVEYMYDVFAEIPYVYKIDLIKSDHEGTVVIEDYNILEQFVKCVNKSNRALLDLYQVMEVENDKQRKAIGLLENVLNDKSIDYEDNKGAHDVFHDVHQGIYMMPIYCLPDQIFAFMHDIIQD